MSSDAINMSFRVNKDLKKEADELFKKLGLNTSVALNMFLTQSVREQAIPFTVTTKIPNKRLIEALEEAKKINDGEIDAKRYDSFSEVIEEIDNGKI